jgi:hypothetical protein
MNKIEKLISDEMVSSYTQHLTFVKRLIFGAVVAIATGLTFVCVVFFVTAVVKAVFSLFI